MVGSKYVVGFIIALILGLTSIWWGFATFHQDIYDWLNIQTTYQVFFGEIGLKVTIADETKEWQKGLSGVKSMGELEGKLFIFDKEGRYGIWMKDMKIPLDILWIDNDFRVVYIEESVKPETYPKTFTNIKNARFVLEVNKDFVKSFAITEGSILTLPPQITPTDLQK